MRRAGQNLFVNADCVAGAKRHLADASVDLIVTDPPYGIEGDKLHKHYNRDERFVVDGYVEVPSAEYSAFSRNWIAQAARVLRPGGAAYIVSGYTNLRHVMNAAEDVGLREAAHIVWKFNFGVWTTRKFVSSHYHVLYYVKPGGEPTFRPTDEEDGDDVWLIKREYKPGRIKNKNELPSALLRRLIGRSSDVNDVVADFFLGGGSTAQVAMQMGRRVVGFEASPTIFSSRVGALLRDVRAQRAPGGTTVPMSTTG